MNLGTLLKARDMNRVQNIILNPDFQQILQEMQELEKTRQFCRHDLPHLLDTARIAYILSLERWTGHQKDVIYAAALLHDIGRVREYRDGSPHDKVGAQMAVPILEAAGYQPQEIDQIVAAIAGHREVLHTDSLGDLLYQADKASRCCFVCPVRSACSWSEDQKNSKIYW